MAKKILITGKNGYIGSSLEKWLMEKTDEYIIEFISVRGSAWKEKDFSSFDIVFHAAGIAHIKETKSNKQLYYEVNRDMAYDLAKKAKIEGVKQFIFLSTMSVYGLDEGIIDQHTPLKPKDAYGKSKAEAEKLISRLIDDSFIIAILRPPMVYGKGCKGNYQRLSRLSKITPFFPKIDNKRSMIYIDNLTEFIKLLIDHQSEGIFFPQNKDYVNTSEMVRIIAKTYKKKIKITGFFNKLLLLIKIPSLKKVFGSLVYEKRISIYDNSYIVCDFEESILKTEGVSE